MSKSVLRRNSELLALTFTLVLCMFGCQAIKKMFVKPPPPPEGVVYKSYTDLCHGYKLSMIVKASPGELIDYLAKDISWLEDSPMRAEFLGLKPGMDLTEIGQLINFNVKMLGINFPCQMITIKYEECKKLWLLVLGPGFWETYRFEMIPAPEGSLVTLDVIGSFSKSLGAVVDTFHLAKEAAAAIDRIGASIQVEFDPDLDVKELIAMGLRGETYEKFLQGYEARIWVDAPMEKTRAWLSVAENFPIMLPEFKIEDRYLSQYVQAPIGEVVYVPAHFGSFLLKLKTPLFGVKTEKGKAYITRFYIIAFGKIGFFETHIQPEAGGTLATLRMVVEIPPVESSDTMNLMLYLTTVFPKLLQERALLFKKEVEGKG